MPARHQVHDIEQAPNKLSRKPEKLAARACSEKESIGLLLPAGLCWPPSDTAVAIKAGTLVLPGH